MTGAATAPDVGSERSWLAPLFALAAFGVFAVAVAFTASRAGYSWAQVPYWSGLLIIFGGFAWRLVGTGAGDRERLGLVAVLGLALYAIKVLHSPDQFTFHDEFGQYRGADDILRTGGLYSFNPLVTAYADYPGLGSVTAGLARLGHIGIFPAGIVVIGVARLVLVISLFGLVARVTNSARIAGIASLIYVAHPNFLYFDAQFGYESLGLALVAATLLATTYSEAAQPGRWIAVAAALVCAGGAVVTHHLSSYAMVAMLVVWAVASMARRYRRKDSLRNTIPVIAGFALAFAIVWAAIRGGATESQLDPIFQHATSGLWDVITGGGAKHPFTAAPGYSDPLLTRIVGITGVLLLLVALPFGLRAVWRQRRVHPVVAVLGLVALAYPATLALRLTQDGTESSNRSSAFVFLGLGVAIGIALAAWVSEQPADRRRATAIRAGAVGALAIVFVAGPLIGWPPYARLPGNYEVSASARSVETEGVETARWAKSHLPDQSTMLADATNKGLMVAYGHQDPKGGYYDGTPIGALFFGPEFNRRQAEIVRGDRLTYLVIDSRLAEALPRTGRYFDSGNPYGKQKPPSPEALAKFEHVPSLDKIYSSDHIAIYDANHAEPEPGAAGR